MAAAPMPSCQDAAVQIAYEYKANWDCLPRLFLLSDRWDRKFKHSQKVLPRNTESSHSLETPVSYDMTMQQQQHQSFYLGEQTLTG